MLEVDRGVGAQLGEPVLAALGDPNPGTAAVVLTGPATGSAAGAGLTAKAGASEGAVVLGGSAKTTYCRLILVAQPTASMISITGSSMLPVVITRTRAVSGPVICTWVRTALGGRRRSPVRTSAATHSGPNASPASRRT